MSPPETGPTPEEMGIRPDQAAPTQPETRKPKIETVLDLPPERRALERARLSSEMQMTKVDYRGNPQAPIELVATSDQATAFIDLVRASTSPEKLSVIIRSLLPNITVDHALGERITQNRATAVRGGNSDTTIISIQYEAAPKAYLINFGYATNGTSVEITPNRGLNISLNEAPDVIMGESLNRLYQLTGQPKFLNALGAHQEMRARGDESGKEVKTIDPAGYYAALGLNPDCLRFMPEALFESIVKGIKRTVVGKLHPDVTGVQLDRFEIDYYQRTLAAAEVLSNKEQRDKYNAWLK